ncbi:MAG: hypothetical protein WC329_03875 [Candidatus Omnitrophota bacterium]|jgi:cell division protein FtsB
MKYTDVVLTLIALLLAFIILRLENTVKAVYRLSEENARVADSNVAVAGSSQRLENSILELRKQVAETGEKLVPGGR